MLRFLWVLLFLATGCGKPTLQLGEFARYIEKFQEQSVRFGKSIKVVDLIVEFGSIQDEAVCIQSSGSTPRILVNKERWNRIDETRREIVMLHELGHCVLGRVHFNKATKGRPQSLMHPDLVEDRVYQNQEQYYLEELFNGL